MYIERHAPSGAYLISDMVDGFLFRRRFEGYSRREAVSLFRDERREAKAKGF